MRLYHDSVMPCQPLKLLNLILFVALLYPTPSSSDEDGVLDNELEEELEDPVEAVFITQSKQEMVNAGGEFRLPCFLETMSDYVLVWKFSGSGQTDTILSVDQKVIDREEGGRVRVEKEDTGNWLVVSHVEEEDSGTYTCMVSAFQPKYVEHRVIVRSRPEVAVQRDLVTVEEGDEVVLECRVVKGKPLPELTWQDSQGTLLSRGSTLRLKSVSADASGSYICRGDNGFSSGGSVSEVELVVEHAPKALRPMDVVHLINGTVDLICDIVAQPPADFQWALEGALLDGELGQTLQVGVEDGENATDVNYTCIASNKLGQANKTFLLTSKPSQPVFTSPQNANLGLGSYSLEWHVISFLPVQSFHIKVSGPSKYSIDKIISAEGPEGPESRYNGKLKLETHRKAMPPGIYKAVASATNTHGEGKSSEQFEIAINMDQLSAATLPFQYDDLSLLVFLIVTLHAWQLKCNVVNI